MSIAFSLTGGIASGKSTVAGILAQHGIPVVDADRLARELVVPGLIRRISGRTENDTTTPITHPISKRLAP